MLTLLTLINLAAAQDAAPAPEANAPEAAQATAPDTRYEEALRLADALIAEGATHEARAILNWLMQPDKPQDIRDRAANRTAALPREKDAAARVRLLPWQTAMGAWLLGPNILWINELRGNFNTPQGLVFLGAVAGGGAGAAASLLYEREDGLSHGQVTAIVHSQQLAIVDGAWVASRLADDSEAAGWGILGGAAVGSAAGYALAGRDVDEGAMAGARTGALWGTGLAFAIPTMINEDYWYDGEDARIGGTLLIGANAGTVGGYFLAQKIGLRRVDAQMAIGGGVAGGLVGLGLVAVTDDLVLWSQRGAIATTGVFTLAGGALGYTLAQGLERPLPSLAVGTLLSGTDDAPVWGLPLPSVVPTAHGLAASVQLVDMKF